MLQQLVTLAEDQGSVPSTHTAAHNCLLLQFHRTRACFWLSRAPGIHEIYIHLRTDTYT